MVICPVTGRSDRPPIDGEFCKLFCQHERCSGPKGDITDRAAGPAVSCHRAAQACINQVTWAFVWEVRVRLYEINHCRRSGEAGPECGHSAPIKQAGVEIAANIYSTI